MDFSNIGAATAANKKSIQEELKAAKIRAEHERKRSKTEFNAWLERETPLVMERLQTLVNREITTAVNKGQYRISIAFHDDLPLLEPYNRSVRRKVINRIKDVSKRELKLPKGARMNWHAEYKDDDEECLLCCGLCCFLPCCCEPELRTLQISWHPCCCI